VVSPPLPRLRNESVALSSDRLNKTRSFRIVFQGNADLSDRPPQDGDCCMGVWKRTGKNTYKLNHFAWLANDTANAPGGVGNPTGPVRIFEEITLGPGGKCYTGKFTLDAYDTLGNQLARIVGVVAGTRITLDTTVPDLL